MIRGVRAVVVAVAAPTFGFVAAHLWLARAAPAPGLCQESAAACAWAPWVGLLQAASLAAGLVGLALLALFWSLAAFAGLSERRNASLFAPTAVAGSALVGLLLVLHAALVVGGVATLADAFTTGMGFWLLALLGVAAALAVGALLGPVLRANRPHPVTLLARAAAADEAPALRGAIEAAWRAQSAGDPPQTVVVGLDPGLFATAAPLRLIAGSDAAALEGAALEGAKIKGANAKGSATHAARKRDARASPPPRLTEGVALYLSLPLLRALTPEELDAALQSEAARMAGDRGRYARGFLPVFRDFAAARAAARRGLAPSGGLLSVLFDAFARNAQAIRPIRDRRADAAAAKATRPGAAAAALVAVASSYAVGRRARAEDAAAIRGGVIAHNLAERRAQAISDARESRDAARTAPRDRPVPHPTEADPIDATALAGPRPASAPDATLGARLGLLGPEAVLTARAAAAEADAPAQLVNGLVNGLEPIEVDLTRLEHRRALAQAPSGASTPAAVDAAALEAAKDTAMRNAAYLLGARMLWADGAPSPDSIDAAAQIGRRIFDAFDPEAFAEWASDTEPLASYSTAVELFDQALSADAKEFLFEYLSELARLEGVDGASGPRGGLLAEAAQAWRVPPR